MFATIMFAGVVLPAYLLSLCCTISWTLQQWNCRAYWFDSDNFEIADATFLNVVLPAPTKVDEVKSRSSNLFEHPSEMLPFVSTVWLDSGAWQWGLDLENNCRPEASCKKAGAKALVKELKRNNVRRKELRGASLFENI